MDEEERLTATEAFEAMRSFLAQFNERESPDNREVIDLLLSWTEIMADGVTSDPAQWDDWERSIDDARARLRTHEHADHLANRDDTQTVRLASPPIGIATKLDTPSVGLDSPMAAISFRRTPEQVADPVLAWQRSDRLFFAAGACHILACQFTRRHPGFVVVQIRPLAGHGGSHLFATDGTRAFDFNGWSGESDLIRCNVDASRLESPGWDYELVKAEGDFDRFCRSIRHRTPAQYPGDVLARADRFIDSLI